MPLTLAKWCCSSLKKKKKCFFFFCKNVNSRKWAWADTVPLQLQATVTSAQNRYWLPTILAPCSQISELALGYTVAMVRGLSAYEKKERKKKRKENRRRFLHCGPDFVPTPAAGYRQLFQLVTFKSSTRGMFEKSQLDKRGLNMEVAQKQCLNVTVANVKSQNVNSWGFFFSFQTDNFPFKLKNGKLEWLAKWRVKIT